MNHADGQKEWTIGEAAQRAGISVRTFHHYDSIGLLSPSRVSQAGYRYYDEAAMMRLEQILFFRELGFALEEIRRMMTSPGYDARDALQKQKALLIAKRERLDAMIARLERAQREMSAEFEVFDMTKIEQMKKQYEQEVRERWGDTQAYAESQKREAGYTAKDYDDIQAGMQALMGEFAAVRALEPEDARVQALVKKWQDYITARFYPCTDEILKGLGQMYVADERFQKNIDQQGEGTALCMSRAIEAYCRTKGV